MAHEIAKPGIIPMAAGGAGLLASAPDTGFQTLDTIWQRHPMALHGNFPLVMGHFEDIYKTTYYNDLTGVTSTTAGGPNIHMHVEHSQLYVQDIHLMNLLAAAGVVASTVFLVLGLLQSARRERKIPAGLHVSSISPRHSIAQRSRV